MSLSQQPVPSQFPTLATPTSIDYSSKDFSSLVQSMLLYAAQAFPDWNPLSEGDFGLVMLELFAYTGDILSFYGDRISQEAYLPTATQRLSLLNISAALGYVPYGALPASGTVTFATATGGAAVTVPAGTQVTCSSVPAGLLESPVYETQAAVTVPGNGGTAVASVSQGITYQMVQLGVSDGTPGQVFQIPNLEVTTASVRVYVESDDPLNPEPWAVVSFLIDAGADSSDFTVSTDQGNVSWVTFGDNRNGMIPGLGLTVWATYTVIVGSAGNLAAGTVDTIASTLDGVTVALGLDGVSRLSSTMLSGSDPETNDSIRANAAQAFSTQYRAVGLQDYASMALAVPGVLMSSAVEVHSSSVSLYIAGPGYQAPSTSLVNSLLDYFDSRTVMGTSLSVLPPAIISIDVGSVANLMTLGVKDRYSRTLVSSNVRAALKRVLNPPNTSFGQLINVSLLYETVLAVDGVDYCSIPVFTREDTPQADTTSIQLRPSEFPVAGNILLNVVGGF